MPPGIPESSSVTETLPAIPGTTSSESKCTVTRNGLTKAKRNFVLKIDYINLYAKKLTANSEGD